MKNQHQSGYCFQSRVANYYIDQLVICLREKGEQYKGYGVQTKKYHSRRIRPITPRMSILWALVGKGWVFESKSFDFIFGLEFI